MTDQPRDEFQLLTKAGGDPRARYGLPLAVLAELTHRCPLQCSYCSNPVELESASRELTTEDWLHIIDELADIGVLQIHFSGGEPTVRKDLVTLVAHARARGMYSNLITSAVLLPRDRLVELADAGLNHVQISVQGADVATAERIGGLRNAHAKKLQAAQWVKELDLPLTVNAVMHRQNLAQLPQIIDLAVELKAERIEVASVQYYGWALKNRAALMPSRAQMEEATATVMAARARLHGTLEIDYVVPDYYAERPKQCMGGWGRQFFTISPSGKVLPCHAAESITGLEFDVLKKGVKLADIWDHSKALNLYRGTDWMPEPCRSCDFKEIDFGGCRCQAFALTGNAANADPACVKSAHHARLFETAKTAAEGDDRLLYRNFSGGTLEPDA